MQETYKIRPVPKSDYNQVADLWILSFTDFNAPLLPQTAPSYHEFLVDYCDKAMSYLVGAYEGNNLAAVAGYIDFPMHFETNGSLVVA